MSMVLQPHEAVRAVLLAAPAVIDVPDHIRPWHLWRTDTLPAITYTTIIHEGKYTYEGPIASRRRRLQLTCWAAGFDAAWSLANLVHGRLDGYGSQQHGNIHIHRITIEDIDDLAQDPNHGAEQPPFGVRLDVMIAYEHIVPISNTPGNGPLDPSEPPLID